MATISVIIPAYNCARWLPESLDSVLAQTCPAAEVIVVDDGSTDDTPAVLARYADRVRLVPGTHGGYAAARNLGLAAAQGDWVAFHDADDIALPDRLAWQLGWVEARRESDGVFANGTRLDTGAALVPAELARREAAAPLSPADVFAGFPVYFQAALVRRAAFAAVGPFDESLRIHADMDYGYRLFARRRIGFVDRSAFRYRWHTTNVTRDRLRGREEIARILARLNDDPEAARRVGPRRLRARLARHYCRIARGRLKVGNAAEAGAAFERAAALRPLDPRYRLLRLWHAR
jgi:glycosyltransferase involved in cell wall biosynthesis